MPIRAYRENISLTPAQQEIITDLRRQGRSLWNTLVIRTKEALGDIDHGKRYSLCQRYLVRLRAKQAVGMATHGFPRIRKFRKFKALSPEKQKEFFAKLIERRRSRKAKESAPWDRRLAVEFACESLSVDFQLGAVHGIKSQLFHRLVEQFRDSASRWTQFKRGAGAPRTKNETSPVSLKAQLHVQPVEGVIDLSAFHPLLQYAKLTPRRGQPHDLPADGEVRFVALAVSNIATQVVMFVKAAEESYAVKFQACPDQVIGIDPGYRTPAAYSTPDGALQGKIEPKNVRRTTQILKKMARIQRKLDRQRRSNNPGNYNPDGTFKKGRRSHKTSLKMTGTLTKLAMLSGALANRRLESYRLAARMLLNSADTVNIGVWRHARQGGEKTKKKRAMNRAGGDVAISMLAGILDDYARRSKTKKTIVHVNEHLSTRTCPDCHTVSAEKIPLAVRHWKCQACGSELDRDLAAARNLAGPALALVPACHST